MSPTALGVVVGGVLGLLDGLSAWYYPEARSMMVSIVIGSTIKGVLTGLATGLVARWRQSLPLGVVMGLAVGFALSALAAIGQPDHYWAIVLPGMLVGVLTGIATQRARPAIVVALCILPVTLMASGQQPVTDGLAPLDRFIGKWQGTTEGQPGTGTVEREYSRVLNGRFIHERNRSVYPAQAKNPKGEIHEHVSYFSFDRTRKRIVFRQFHQEGFINQYVEDGDAPAGKLVFTTEAIENIPAGWRARETYTFTGADEFEEVFELAGPGKPFELYSRNRFKRAK